MRKALFTAALLSFFQTPLLAETIPYAAITPEIDGIADDSAWQSADWRDIKYLTLGASYPASEDFTGRFKLLWNEAGLYVLAEIQDDVLIDTHADPLKQYWEDDTLELFVDADASGGDHQHNYNAFAYHIALDNQAIDIGPFPSQDAEQRGERFVRTFPEHVTSRWQRSDDAPNSVFWEVHIKVFGDDFVDDADNAPLQLKAGQAIGFMVSYCDADGSDGRQHFIGDVDIAPVDGNKDRGYIDASVFRRVTLVR